MCGRVELLFMDLPCISTGQSRQPDVPCMSQGQLCVVVWSVLTCCEHDAPCIPAPCFACSLVHKRALPCGAAISLSLMQT